MKLEHHDYANIFPMLQEPEMAGLAADIKANGQIDPIILHEGKILDGRNRYAACRIAGVEPITEQFTGADALAFVLGHNLHRRHLTASQLAMIAEKVATIRHGEMGNGRKVELSTDNSTIEPDRKTRKQAAVDLGVSEPSIDRARVVRKRGIPELSEAVESGKVTVRRAAAIANMPQDLQPEAIKSAIEGNFVSPQPAGRKPAQADAKPRSFKNAKVIESNGMAIFAAAKSVMDRLSNADTQYHESLQAMQAYCQDRITTSE